VDVGKRAPNLADRVRDVLGFVARRHDGKRFCGDLGAQSPFFSRWLLRLCCQLLVERLDILERRLAAGTGLDMNRDLLVLDLVEIPSNVPQESEVVGVRRLGFRHAGNAARGWAPSVGLRQAAQKKT